MKSRFAKHLTFSNVVACLALFIALGGVSYAAVKLPKNSVGAKQIKKNAVTESKIKRSAVTGAKIKSKTVRGSDLGDNTVTGTQINEAALGEVPSAASAGSARNRFTFVKRVNATAADNDQNVARAAATEVPIVSNGQVSVYMKCFVDADNNLTVSEIFVKTNTDGAYASVYENKLTGNPGLDTSTPETTREVLGATAANNNTGYEYGYGNLVLGTDAKGLVFTATTSARYGNPPNPTSLYTALNACIVSVDGALVE
jgi:hypothetical protein